MRYLLSFIFIVTFAVCLLTSHASAVSTDEMRSQTDTDSLRQLEEAIEHAPKDGDLWVRLGYAYFSAGDLKQAEKAFRNGMRYVNSAALYNGMGLVFMYSKTHHKYNALQYFRRALGIDPTYIEAHPQTQLRISDLELAWQISEKKEIGKFSKGHLEVIPMPTRTYPRDRSIYVYYEIYNLKHNAFGQTRYRVVYTIRSQKKMTLGALVSQLVKTITRGEDEEIAIDFEQVGKGSSEAAYVALDLTACGLGRHTVSVEITDLESGEKAVKEASFVVAD